MGKTVYILGAGFSKAARFPLQRELLQAVLDDISLLTGDILSKPEILLESFRKDRELIKNFANASFPSRENLQFEDVFTLLDEVILERAHFGKYPETELREIRSAWIRAILFTLHYLSEQHLMGSNMCHRAIAAALIEQRVRAKISGDPFSIISLNWDSLVEDSIYWVLKQVGAFRDGKALADIDYCVYTTPLPNSPHTPSTKQRARQIYNIKLLKMHGSSTWLRCPCSNLVYTGLGMNEPAHDIYVKHRVSPFIQEHLDEREKDSPSVLEPFIITPTFTKVFDLPHIQTTWHNAFVELREADEVIFIGYSLPDADYHFRTFLRRAIRSKTKIKVILDATAEPPKNPLTADPRIVYPAQRYRQVFRDEQLTFNYDGVEGFAKNFAPEDQLPSTLERIKNNFFKPPAAIP
jgi:hypothetical protein